MTLFLTFALAAILNFQGGDGQGEFIPLRDGEILVGEISTHDEDGLDVKRLDNGGLVHLRWGQLAPPFERSLRLKLGYIYEQDEEIQVDADELTLIDGTKRVGRVVSQGNDQYVLKDSKATLTYPRSMVVGAPARVRVAALEMYTKDELYNDKLGTVDATTPQGNMDLARYLEQINDFTRAIQHWNEVKKLDATFHPGEAAESLKRLEDKKARQDEIDYLQELESQRKQRHWDNALAMCDEFPKKFVKSTPAARADVEKRKKSISDAKRLDQIDHTWKEYHRQVRVLLYKKAADPRLALDDARSYARGEVRKDILAATVLTLQKTWKELTEQEVAALWKDRGKRPITYNVGYGPGTFILGKSGAEKNVTNMPGTRSAPTGNKGNGEMEAMAKKLQELLKKSASPQNPAEQKKLSPEDAWWVTATVFSRVQFLIANFVEFGGEMKDLLFTARVCSNCSGQGGLPVMNVTNNPGGVSVGGGGRNSNNNNNNQASTGVTYVECPTCHGIGFQRCIEYR